MSIERSIGASSTQQERSWKTLPWTKIKAQVFRLQTRIAKAEREGRKGRVTALQRLLTSSFYAKCLAVKRVTSNKGSKTPGVDGIVLKTQREKMTAVFDIKRSSYNPSPLRRIHIPKKTGTLRTRPLSIPTIKDRAMQAIWHMALSPVAEERADPNAYGFRQKRSTHDAVTQCFIALGKGKSAGFVLEGDIKACFDRIDHDWLLQNIPMDKIILRKFLKAGFMEKGEQRPTELGTPQGGIISPTLAVMALSGLEHRIRSAKAKQRDREKINMVAYADDFIVTAASEQLLREKVIPTLVSALSERGLELSKEKTKITPIDKGFEFLGFNIRKYKCGKLLIKPSKANICNFLREIRRIIKRGTALPTEVLIYQLNQKITGWTNYYRSAVSSKVFSRIDSEIFTALKGWCFKRHARKGKLWIIRNYYARLRDDRWRFHCVVRDRSGNKKILYLKNATETHIRRHRKIWAEANPFDPRFKEYFERRDRESKSRIFTESHTKSAGWRITQPYEGLSGVR
jgi:RNA-directed DNA polymerase